MELDLRKLRYFVAVAEELHFGRAADKLHIAQPVLSRQIRSLEGDLKVQLFARDKRGTELTAAGEQLLSDARPLLSAADATTRRAVRAAHAQNALTVGFMPGLIVTAAVRLFSRRHPDVQVEVIRTNWDEQTQMICDGRIDVGYVRLPCEAHGLELRDLLSEPRVVILPTTHPLAGKSSVSISDLAGERLLQNPAAIPEWRSTANPSGPYEDTGPTLVLRSVEEKLENVAAGRGVVILPLSTATYYTRSDITHIEISDIGPNRVCLAWDSNRQDQLIDEFVEIALAT
ncbi:LysR substrate-binding domain-containing protein [Streptomyces sp. NBC_00996]|uniref:LysR substrate-binding domain-containing protein n=1 Tax=Streptomyces sp. NBC_00996 TaxID=2903710 RepID=UPI00386E5407|nr:LysR substrate-binding domain-containing protein [Streptomyces sp. NBC_00996]